MLFTTTDTVSVEYLYCCLQGTTKTSRPHASQASAPELAQLTLSSLVTGFVESREYGHPATTLFHPTAPSVSERPLHFLCPGSMSPNDSPLCRWLT